MKLFSMKLATHIELSNQACDTYPALKDFIILEEMFEHDGVRNLRKIL